MSEIKVGLATRHLRMARHIPNNRNKSPKYIQQPNSRPPRMSVGSRLKYDVMDVQVRGLLVGLVVSTAVVLTAVRVEEVVSVRLF